MSTIPMDTRVGSGMMKRGQLIQSVCRLDYEVVQSMRCSNLFCGMCYSFCDNKYNIFLHM
mgnify:CR=1 FL=1